MDNAALSFLTKDRKEFPDVSLPDSDLLSWLLIHSDLVPSTSNTFMTNHFSSSSRNHQVSTSNNSSIYDDEDDEKDDGSLDNFRGNGIIASSTHPSLIDDNNHMINKNGLFASTHQQLIEIQPELLSPPAHTLQFEKNQSLSQPLASKPSLSTKNGGSSVQDRFDINNIEMDHQLQQDNVVSNGHSTSQVKSESMKKPPAQKKRKLSTVNSVLSNGNDDLDSGGMLAPSPRTSLSDEDISNLTPEEKRQRRLERNREIAKNCRKRKRERITALEDELVRLREWNKQLEKKLNQSDGGENKEEIRQKELREITAMVKAGASESELKKKLEAYKEVYSDFGKQRGIATTFHLNELKTLLLPNQVSKMTIWSLQQEDEFYDETKNQAIHGGGIWNMLCNALKLTEEQKKSFVEMRYSVKTQRKNVGECIKILHELEKRIDENFASMAAQMSTIMQTISPLQQANFLIWIENNQPFMHMLSYLYNQSNGFANSHSAVSSPSKSSSIDDSRSESGSI